MQLSCEAERDTEAFTAHQSTTDFEAAGSSSENTRGEDS
jgi:hypothetical protein